MAYDSRIFLLLGLAILPTLWLNWKKLPLPPGPRGSFWRGSVRQVPTHLPWITYERWAKTYGPIFTLRLYNTKVIVLNSAKVALDLLESRSNIYSDRPWSPLSVLLDRESSLFIMSSQHPRFKKYRRLLHTGLNPRASASYRELQMKEVVALLKRLANTPQDFVKHIQWTVAAVILKVAYGYQVEEEEDFLIKLIEGKDKLSRSLTTRRSRMVEGFPILRYLPPWLLGLAYKKELKPIAAELSQTETVPFSWTKKQIVSGNYLESFTSKLLEQGGKGAENDHEDVVMWVTSALYQGGVDTTPSVMMSFIWLMATHPEVQERAHQELDQVVGDRLPGFEDFGSLKYTSALLKEIVRWGPVTPLGLRHNVVVDDVYEGFRIPKNTTVIANIWAITHDDELYPNPSKFDPERHLGSEPQTNPFKFVFGFGRRTCPGAHFAEQSLLLNISSILSTFRIKKAKDKDGGEIYPPLEWSTGITSNIKPFPCEFELRSKETSARLAFD